MKKEIAIFLLAASVASATTIQRRSEREIAEDVQNATGEVTYSIGEDGSAVLRVGTSDRGTVHVTDPCAVHLAPRRLLDSSEYAVTLGVGCTWTEDGGICFANNVVEPMTRTATIDIAVACAFAGVEFDEYGSGQIRAEVTDNRIVLTCKINRPATAPGGDSMIVSSSSIGPLKVYAYTTEKHVATWDTVLDTVTIKDSVGSVQMHKFRQWEIDRTNGHLAEDWSRFAASSTVKLGGQSVWLNRTGTISAMNAGQLATNAWSIVAYGHPVLSVYPGFQSDAPGGAFRIVDMEMLDDSCVIYVTAGLRADVAIQYTTSLEDDEISWLDETNQTSSYPTIVMRKDEECYRLEVPFHGDSCFWRATCTVSADSPTELHISNCDIYVDGVKVGWKTINVGGQNIKVLAEAE